MRDPGEPPGRDWFGSTDPEPDGEPLAGGHAMALAGLAGDSDGPTGRFAGDRPPGSDREPDAGVKPVVPADPTPRTHLRAVPAPEPEVTVDDPSATDSADFRVRCPDCGPQYVAVADIRFVSTGGGADTDRYLFTCPVCGARVRRPAGPELAEILRTSGVATLALHRQTDQAL